MQFFFHLNDELWFQGSVTYTSGGKAMFQSQFTALTSLQALWEEIKMITDLNEIGTYSIFAAEASACKTTGVRNASASLTTSAALPYVSLMAGVYQIL